ncbi:MAG: DUF4097 family beta strand repeat-containing protein [Candidatus Neomarinimicrobiota bacterium]
MKIMIPFIFILQIIFSQDIFESFDTEGSTKYKGKTVYEFDVDIATTPIMRIQNVKGDIHIKGIPGNNAQIKEIVKVKTSSKSKAYELFSKYRSMVQYHEESNLIEITGNGSWPSRISFEYEITVPKSLSTYVHTLGGDIDIEHIVGEIDAKTSGGNFNLSYLTGRLSAVTAGGDIELDHAMGNVLLSTSGGDVEATDVEGKINANTSGGDIDITYSQGDVSVNTMGGNIYLLEIEGETMVANTSAGDINIEAVKSGIVVHTHGGDLDIEDVIGDLRGSTSYGDIDLYNIMGAVDVLTTAGSIMGENLSGSISAITEAGDIYIEKHISPDISDHSILLRTAIGDIQVVLPPDFPGKIDALVEDTQSIEAIYSEFPLTIIKTMDDIRGEGIIGGGVHTVKIRTHYGEIEIETDED